ncbi:MAG: hypothetical protein ACKPKO_15045, partial [Candidatus Fonsibacter sp.]
HGHGKHDYITTAVDWFTDIWEAISLRVSETGTESDPEQSAASEQSAAPGSEFLDSDMIWDGRN